MTSPLPDSPIYEVSDADFQTRVLDRSHTVPVVVDFWAEWCGPCRALAPVLEKELHALGGRVELAKLDTDANQATAARYQIRSIPAVKAFRNGVVVDEFIGAQPAPVIRQFLARLAPSEARQALERAQAAFSAGDKSQAESVARTLLDMPDVEPALADEAALLVAGILIGTGRADQVEGLLTRIDPRSPAYERVEALGELVRLASAATSFGGEAAARAALDANEKDLEARYALGAALASRGDTPEALEQFLDLVTRSRKFRDDGGRRAILALFNQPGVDPEVVREFRRRLQIVT